MIIFNLEVCAQALNTQPLPPIYKTICYLEVCAQALHSQTLPPVSPTILSIRGSTNRKNESKRRIGIKIVKLSNHVNSKVIDLEEK